MVFCINIFEYFLGIKCLEKLSDIKGDFYVLTDNCTLAYIQIRGSVESITYNGNLASLWLLLQ